MRKVVLYASLTSSDEVALGAIWTTLTSSLASSGASSKVESEHAGPMMPAMILFCTYSLTKAMIYLETMLHPESASIISSR